MIATLYLEDGTIFYGKYAGSPVRISGELVFNTCHTGYEEVQSDPSYMGQIVVFTASHIGNTGVTLDDLESKKMYASALICKELSPIPDNHRSQLSLQDWLIQQNKICLYDIDTRALAKKLRSAGVMRGMIVPQELSDKSFLAQMFQEQCAKDGSMAQNFAALASCSATYTLGSGSPHIAVLDFGIKQGILDQLVTRGVKVTVFPWDATFDDIRKVSPHGIFLSNGPGDPAWLHAHTPVTRTVAQLMDSYPVAGICLGHQLIALASGGKTEKLMFGHHAANHPIRERINNTEKYIQVTSQNHNYVVIGDSVNDAFEITHVHLNDGSVAGMKHRKKPVISVQFHPESNPGPHDSGHFFQKFLSLMRGSL